jgi:predicted ABC-type ATPase
MSDLRSLLKDLDAIKEMVYPPHTVRVWGNFKYQKDTEGTWQKIGPAHATLALPAHAVEPQPGLPDEHPKGDEEEGPEAPKPAPNPRTTPMPAGRKWIDAAPGLPTSTADAHFERDDNGRLLKPKPQRKALHDKIVSTFSDHVKPPPSTQAPVAIVMMGGPASGKSSIASGIPKEHFVNCNSDDVKELIPEYQEAVKKSAKNAARMAHEESNYVMQQVRNQALKDRKNILMDGTGKEADKYLAFIQTLKKNGYHVHVMMPDLDKDEAKKRATARAEVTGRWVPEEIIDKAYDAIPQNFEPIARAGDDFSLYDANGRPPRLVWSKVGDKETVHDHGYVERFKSRHARKEWVENINEALSLVLFETPHHSNKKPPARGGKEIQGYFDAGHKKDHEALKHLPKKFKKGEGIILPDPDDAVVER